MLLPLLFVDRRGAVRDAGAADGARDGGSCRRCAAYTINLAGSLAGVVALRRHFVAASCRRRVWFGVAFAAARAVAR